MLWRSPLRAWERSERGAGEREQRSLPNLAWGEHVIDLVAMLAGEGSIDDYRYYRRSLASIENTPYALLRHTFGGVGAAPDLSEHEKLAEKLDALVVHLTNANLDSLLASDAEGRIEVLADAFLELEASAFFVGVSSEGEPDPRPLFDLLRLLALAKPLLLRPIPKKEDTSRNS